MPQRNVCGFHRKFWCQVSMVLPPWNRSNFVDIVKENIFKEGGPFLLNFFLNSVIITSRARIKEKKKI